MIPSYVLKGALAEDIDVMVRETLNASAAACPGASKLLVFVNKSTMNAPERNSVHAALEACGVDWGGPTLQVVGSMTELKGALASCAATHDE